ncbi:MAG: hypothetical protein PHU34_07290 [Candidatus Methanoperedens sp.]|nr:hypothetical protein [Candidatus Methanoperedens sp.]
MDSNKKGKSGYFIAIFIFVLFAGCVEDVPSPDTSPAQVVETFYSDHGNYYLMSAEYRDSVGMGSFLGKIIKCKPSFTHYEFVDVINGSEKIEGYSATVEIRYFEIPDKPVFGDADVSARDSLEMKNKTIYLTKENGGWRLRELYCELVGK